MAEFKKQTITGGTVIDVVIEKRYGSGLLVWIRRICDSIGENAWRYTH